MTTQIRTLRRPAPPATPGLPQILHIRVIGAGGPSTPTPVSDFDMPHNGVLITSIGPGSPQVQHPTITTTEPAPWSGYRDLQTPYESASFDVVPHEPGGTTSITVTHTART